MLDSYYEIDHDGRKYFGNVALKEFHQFRSGGDLYLFNVATMTPYRISEPVARLVDRAAGSFSGGLLSEPAMEALKKLDLVAGFDRSPEPAAESGDDAERGRASVASLTLFVAQQCNMACVYCYGQSGEYTEKGMMSTDAACRAVDWLMENSGDRKSVRVAFFGGEPLMNFELVKRVVKYARHAAEKHGKEVAFGMTTNGSLLTDESIAYLRKENIPPLVSFDGPPAVQDRQRPFKNGEGSYKKVHANVRKLLEAFPQTMAHAVLHGDTDPAEVRRGIMEAGFQTFSMIRSSPVILDGDAAKGPPPLDRADERRLAMEEGLARDLLRDIKARTVGPDAMNSTVGFFVRMLISGKKRRYFCGVGKGMVAVTATGDLYPCHRFAGQPEMKLGHLDSYRYDGINDYHRAIVDNLPECGHCWARYVCGGGCMYQNKAARGDMRLPDRSFCLEVKQMMEMAVALYLQLDDEEKTYAEKGLKGELEAKAP